MIHPTICTCGAFRRWSAMRRQFECTRWNCVSPHKIVTLEYIASRPQGTP
jgi:hypothetical protein